MTIKLPGVAVLATVLATVLAACSVSSGPLQLAKVEDIMDRYAGAIRFGEFEKAQDFVAPAKRVPLDLDWLKNVHVSSYDIVRQKEPLGGNIHELTVKIRYYIESEGIEKTITDHQLWRFDEDVGKVQLESGMPTFR